MVLFILLLFTRPIRVRLKEGLRPLAGSAADDAAGTAGAFGAGAAFGATGAAVPWAGFAAELFAAEGAAGFDPAA
ncbi:MAG TPA: hypothetical protein VG963_18450 [Polyangiaceae bacterium]|nr:hypothetical protein [Polyangiaceae bacterium]